MTKLADQLNTLEATVIDTASAEKDKSDTARVHFETTQDVDHLRVMQKALTKSKYVSKLAKVSDKSKKFIAKTFAIEALQEIFKASYSVDKLIELSNALTQKSKSELTSDVMQNMIATLAASNSAEIRFSEFSAAVAHKTDTQVSQTLRLLQRINVVSSYSRAKNEVHVNSDSKVLAEIHKLYE